MPQTTKQREDAIRFGSALLEIGDDFGSLINVGAIRGLNVNFKKENVEVPFDNTSSIDFFKNGLEASFTFDLAETDFTVIQKMEDGWMVQGVTAGVLVPGALQTVLSGAWLEKEFILLDNQNGDGTAVVVNSVTGSVDGALVAGDDYDVVKDGQGNYGIVLYLSGLALTTEVQDLTIDYDYTPSASKDVTFNDFGKKVLKVARITNTDSQGRTLVVRLTEVTNISSLVMPLLADDADDVTVISMELDGTIVDVIDKQSTT